MNNSKEKLRREMRHKLRAIGPGRHAEASLVICELAADLPAFTQSRCVALFAPLSYEPDIRPLAEEAWARKKRVALPLVIKQGATPMLDWHEVTSWDDVFVPGPFGLREPEPLRCPRVPVVEINCVFIPGLAFDHDGYRLGRGGGFYDSFLGQAPPSLASIGLFFTLQKVAAVPRELHDQRLHISLTEDGLLNHG